MPLQVVVLIDQKKIKVTSVDFVRFTWLNKHADREIEDDDDDDTKEEQDFSYNDIPRMQPVEYGHRHYTNPTIWIGVLPDTLSVRALSGRKQITCQKLKGFVWSYYQASRTDRESKVIIMKQENTNNNYT